MKLQTLLAQWSNQILQLQKTAQKWTAFFCLKNLIFEPQNFLTAKSNSLCQKEFIKYQHR